MAKGKYPTSWDDVPVIFDIPYAARLFGFTTDVMSRKCANGEFPAHKVFGKWRINKDEAIAYLHGESNNN